MQHDRIDVRQFITQLGFRSGQDNILAVGYYAEFVEEKSSFGLEEVLSLLDKGKVPRPANPRRDLQILEGTKRFLNPVIGTSGNDVRYTVTNPGADYINDRMAQVGLVLHKPVERAELLKQIAESL